MSKEIFNIINDMADMLSPLQLKRLQEVLVWRLSEEEKHKVDYSNEEYLEMFLAAKKLEGCSDRTVEFYRYTITKIFDKLDIPIIKISTEHLRKYLVEYQQEHNCSKTTIDNIRRNVSSFFSWLEEEDYIIKSPVKRIHKVKTTQRVKSVITDECIERLRDGCNEIRDLAMFDFLLSTGIRVGELVNLNIRDINFENRECIVYGKGDKERKAYFDARSKIHLQEYLASRNDNNPALFVSLYSPHTRLTISGVETRVKIMSGRTDVENLHPHKFRNHNFHEIQTFRRIALDYAIPR